MAKVTIKDIARESRVSIGTVYRAVNNSGRINEATRKRVMETVSRLGYKANSAARGLALRNKATIMVIMPSEPGSFWGDVIQGVRRSADELSDFGVKIIEFYHKDGISQAQSALDFLKANPVDAIAMSIVSLDDSGLILLYAKEMNIPVAIFNDDTVSRDRLFFYGPDNYRAGRMAAELMSKFCGAKGICCTLSSTTGFQSGDSAGISREAGFRDYLEQCRPDIGFKGTFRCSTGEAPLIIREIIQKHPDLNGFYFAEFSQLLNNFRFFADLDRRYVVIGHEYADPYYPALQDGTITAILSQAKVCQGYYPIKILYQYLITGEKPAQEIYYSNVNIIIGANAEYLQYSSNGCGFE